MNIFNLIDRGSKHARDYAKAKEEKEVADRCEVAREQWITALSADEIRAWMDIGEDAKDVVQGLATVLTLVGLAHSFDTNDSNSVEVRIIRSAISAAEQCAKEGCVMTPAYAASFSAAVSYAKEMASAASHQGITNACLYLRKQVAQ